MCVPMSMSIHVRGRDQAVVTVKAVVSRLHVRALRSGQTTTAWNWLRQARGLHPLRSMSKLSVSGFIPLHSL